jgi:hypothetical protein
VEAERKQQPAIKLVQFSFQHEIISRMEELAICSRHPVKLYCYIQHSIPLKKDIQNLLGIPPWPEFVVCLIAHNPTSVIPTQSEPSNEILWVFLQHFLEFRSGSMCDFKFFAGLCLVTRDQLIETLE